jgi:hypothetical protein
MRWSQPVRSKLRSLTRTRTSTAVVPTGAPAPAPQLTRPADSPYLSPRLASLLSMAGVKTDPSDPRAVRLAQARFEADPLADAFVESLEELGTAHGRRLLEQALSHGIEQVAEAPRSLVRLFEQLDSIPVWLDRARVAEGIRTVGRHGPDAMCSLSVMLMGGYLTSRATKPLVMTGALERLAPQRLAATARFTHDVYTSGDMGRFSEGFKTTVRVRVMHAMVRRSLLRSPRWRSDLWGLPINQSDMVVTHLQFSATYLGGVLALGRLDTRRERDAVMHLWRYVSRLLGVDESLLPTDHREGLELLSLFNQTEGGPDSDGPALARALMQAWRDEPAKPGPLGAQVGPFLMGYCRYFLGAQASDTLGIPDDHWQYLPPALAVAKLPWELAQLLSPALRGLAQSRGRRWLVAQFAAPPPHGAPARMPYTVPA